MNEKGSSTCAGRVNYLVAWLMGLMVYRLMNFRFCPTARGDEFDCEVSVPPAFDFACFEGILFKKAYYLKWPKIDKHCLSSPDIGKNIKIFKLFASNPI